MSHRHDSARNGLNLPPTGSKRRGQAEMLSGRVCLMRICWRLVAM